MIKIVKNVGQCRMLKDKYILQTVFEDNGREYYAKISLIPVLYRIKWKIKYIMNKC